MPAARIRFNRSLIVWLSLLLGIIGAAVLWFLIARPAPSLVTISFLGFRTNNILGQQAGFKTVNCGHVTLDWTGSWWIQARGASPPVSYSSSQMSFLGPGQFQTVWIPAPTNQGDWKVTFDYRPEDWRQKLARKLGRSYWGVRFMRALRPLPVHNHRTAASDWVGTQPAGTENK